MQIEIWLRRFIILYFNFLKMIYCPTCQQDFNEEIYFQHLNGDRHHENLVELGEAVIIDYNSSVFLTPPPSPPDHEIDHGLYYQPQLEDDYVWVFSEPNSPEAPEEEPSPQLPPAPRSPRIEDADPQVSGNAPWRYYNRAWLREAIEDGDRVEDDDGDEEDEPLRFFE